MEIPEYPAQSRAMNTLQALSWISWTASTLCSAQTLTIRLYDYSDLKETEIVRSAEVAGVVLGHAGIGITWLHCRGAVSVARPDAQCQTELRDNEIVVKLNPLAPQGKGYGRMGLAYAMVQQQGGKYATVLVPAVRQRTQELGLSFDLLLGYAIAHEAVHCLLGPAHSHSGLMRECWDRKDGEAIGRLSLGLTKQEARKACDVLAATSASASRP